MKRTLCHFCAAGIDTSVDHEFRVGDSILCVTCRKDLPFTPDANDCQKRTNEWPSLLATIGLIALICAIALTGCDDVDNAVDKHAAACAKFARSLGYLEAQNDSLKMAGVSQAFLASNDAVIADGDETLKRLCGEAP